MSEEAKNHPLSIGKTIYNWWIFRSQVTNSYFEICLARWPQRSRAQEAAGSPGGDEGAATHVVH